MNLKQIIILLVVLALCIGGVLVVNSSKSSTVKAPPSVLGEQPFKDLPVNDVTAFSIKGAENEVEVKKVDDKWTVANRGGYAADFSKVSKLIRGLVEVKVAEDVPAGTSALERLELVEPSGEGETKGAGTVVTVSGEGGSELAAFTLGKEYEGGVTSGPFGSYANSTGRFMKKGDSVVVVSGTLTEANADAASWLDKEFFKVQKVSRLEYDAGTEEDSWVLERSEATGDYILLNAGADEELDKPKTGPLKNAFSSPSFKDVLADVGDEVSGLEGGRSFKIETFEGFKYDVRLGNTTDDGDYYMTVAVEADFPTEYVAEEEADGGSESAEGEDGEDAKNKKEEEAKRKEEEFKTELERKQEKLEKERALGGTVFVVNKWSVESLLKKRSEILKEEEEAEGGDSGEATSSAIPVPMPSVGGAAGATTGEPRPRITAVTPPIEVPLPTKSEATAGESGGGDTTEKDGAEGGQEEDEQAEKEEGGETVPAEGAGDEAE